MTESVSSPRYSIPLDRKYRDQNQNCEIAQCDGRETVLARLARCVDMPEKPLLLISFLVNRFPSLVCAERTVATNWKNFDPIQFC